MPDWNRFRKLYVAGLPNSIRLATLCRMERWLDLPPADAATALAGELTASNAKELDGLLQILDLTLRREIGLPSANPDAIVRRLSALRELRCELLRLAPTVSQTSPAELASYKLQQAGTVIFVRLQALLSGGLPLTLTPESMRDLESILQAWRDLITTADETNPGLPHILSLAGGTARMLANYYVPAGRHQDAVDAFHLATALFARAGDRAEEEDCHARAIALEQRLTRNLDAAAAKPLAALGNRTTDSNPWKHTKALIELSDVANEAGDRFEAREKAEAAVAQLTHLGYRDPGDCGADAAVDSWIASAGTDCKDTSVLNRVSQVGMWYLSVLRSRHAVIVRSDVAAADACDALIRQLGDLISRAQREAAEAESALHLELERFAPGSSGSQQRTKQPAGPDFSVSIPECRHVDDELIGIRDACNSRPGEDRQMDDLIAVLRQLQVWADQSGSPDYQAKTRLEEAYVLLRSGRAEDLVLIAQEARSRLLAGRAASLSSLPEARQRSLYLDSLNYEVKGRMMAGQLEAGLELAEATIRDFESERYRVSSEYRQSAMLTGVADIYKWAALAAFRLQKWDNMLQAIDLIKAQSATRSRLIPDPPEGFASALTREFERLSSLPANDPNKAAADSKRREIWDLLSITRAQGHDPVHLPNLTVAAMQASLAEDEALISYFWLNEDTLLTVALDRDRLHAERIALKPEELESLQGFIGFIQHLTNSHNLDRTVAKLGDLLLPRFLRDFIRPKRLIVFSPHHALHQFPFHAARWDEDGFVGTRFAVRYVPNFSSLLLPWTGQPKQQILLIGIREFADPAIHPLANAENDAVEIRHYYESAGDTVTTILGKDATREKIDSMRDTGELAAYRCVHFGTHGLSVFETKDQPLESRLLLQNGALDAMDVANLRLNAELAVLSACHSGQRAVQVRDLGELPGDDIFGLQSALFKSGVRSILGTLWVVEESSASAITRAFHRHFAAGVPAETALQQAVKEYLSGASPLSRGVYYWAPYFISSLGSMPRGE